MSSLLLLSLHACILRHVFAQSPSSHLLRSRQQELDRITRYELFDFDLSSFASDEIIRFAAFDQHFVIQLRLNEQVSPNINHQTRDKLTTHSSEPFQCHYHGRVLSPESTTAAHQSVVALSMCDGRGIRGMVRALGETMYIYPANYYLNASSIARKRFGLHEQHLVYRWSDYNEADLGSEQVAAHIHPPPSSSSMLNTDPEERRRRLIYNNGNNVVELYTLADEAFVNEFKNYYGNSDWFIELYHYISEAVSLASAEYEAGDWDRYANIGMISIHWVELDVVESWGGTFRALQCSPCSYDGKTGRGAYLRKFGDWSADNKDVSHFDFAMLYSRQSDVMSGGSAWIGGVCDSRLKYAVSASDGNMSRQRKLLAHELGHNLGLLHDSDGGCSEGDIMGSDDYNSGWSVCSYKYMADFFSSHQSTITCLAARDNDFVSNHDFQTASPTLKPTLKPSSTPTAKPAAAPTARPTSRPTSQPTPSPVSFSDCVRLKALKQLNGDWSRYNNELLNGWPIYYLNGLYLYTIADADGDLWWVVSPLKGEHTFANGYCMLPNLDIMDCDFYWYRADGRRDKNSKFKACDALEMELDPCLVHSPYASTVCVDAFADETINHGAAHAAMFEVIPDEGCVNDFGVYEYAAAVSGADDAVVAMDRQFYLHFSDRQQWIISADAMSTYGDYVCDSSDLNECVSGKWQQWRDDGDSEMLIPAMNITIAQCSSNIIAAKDDDVYVYEPSKDVLLAESVIIVMVALALTVCSAVCVFWFCSKSNFFDHEKVTFNQIEPDEDSQEIAIEVSFDEDDGMNTTQ